MNVQRNYTGEFTSVVVDVDKRILMPKYPKEIEGKPIEMKLDNGKYILSYFQKPQIRAEMMETAVKSGEDQPFCCNSVRPYKNIRTDKEAIFNQFLQKRGTVQDRLFEVWIMNSSTSLTNLESTNFPNEYLSIMISFSTKKCFGVWTLDQYVHT